jgi:hypothetical protein
MPDFTAGTDMLVEYEIGDDEKKKRQAQVEFADLWANKKKTSPITTDDPPLIQQTMSPIAHSSLIETGAAIAAQSISMLQSRLIASRRNQWSREDNPRSNTPEYRVPRALSPSRSRSRHRLPNSDEEDEDL